MSPVIDFHVHVYPDNLAAQVISELTQSCGFQACFDGTVSGLKAMMRGCGVTQSVIQPVATKVSQVRPINQWSSHLNRESGIRAFGSLHPEMDTQAVKTEVAFIKENHLPGVKMHPEYQNFHPDEDRMEKIYCALEQAKCMLLLHAGMDLGFHPPVKATPERIFQVLKSFPGLTVIAAHLGGYGLWDQVMKYLVNQNVWLDTAYCFGKTPLPEAYEIIQAHGCDKILFGSDAPWGDQGQHVQHLESLPLSEMEKQRIFFGNAAVLLEKIK
ncbi:amidohydrolase family protein [bacterium]|nr:amidohydrolase family protein [bacterium]